MYNLRYINRCATRCVHTLIMMPEIKPQRTNQHGRDTTDTESQKNAGNVLAQTKHVEKSHKKREERKENRDNMNGGEKMTLSTDGITNRLAYLCKTLIDLKVSRKVVCSLV